MPPLRSLLPALHPHHRQPPADRPRKKNIPLACEKCRQFKTKCDGNRPTCGACVKRASDCRFNETHTRQIRVRYEQLKRKESAHEELVEILRTLTEQDAAEVVRRLKAGVDVTSIVRHVRDGDLLMQLSVAPEITRRYELPLLSEMPSHLCFDSNPYLGSLLHQSLFSSLSSHGRSSTTEIQAEENSDRRDQYARETVHQGVSHANQNDIRYDLPYHTARMIEPIIEEITATPWTRVITDDRLFRRLISAYFCYPHPCGPFVHKDLFLADMATGRTSFCSPLLVNAILANATQSCFEIPDRSRVWLPESLTYRFMAEARRLWDMESLPGKSEITTLQAALVLSYHTTNNGLDEIGDVYMKRAREISKDLSLFEPDKHDRGTAMEKARLFTAWALFSWQANLDYHFFRRPSLTEPPQVSLPKPNLEPTWYGEISVQYPHDKTLVPLHTGYGMYAEASLRKIMNNIGLLAFGRSPLQPLTFDELAAIKMDLDRWRVTLPDPLQPELVIFPSHLMLHVVYWQVVKDILQLIVNADYLHQSQRVALCLGKLPETALHEARVKLETVVCLYYARHNFDSYDPWLAYALTIVGNTVAAELKAAPSFDHNTLTGYRSLLILSVQGLAEQSAHYHNGMLLAVQIQGAMDAANLQLVRTYTTNASISTSDQQMLKEHSLSNWPLPAMVALDEDPEKARLNVMIEALQEVQM